MISSQTMTTITVDYMMEETIDARIRILNLQGKVILTKQVQVTEGINEYELSLANYPGGIYIVNITGSKIRRSLRIVKQQM